jgi:hypothetical protein
MFKFWRQASTQQQPQASELQRLRGEVIGLHAQAYVHLLLLVMLIQQRPQEKQAAMRKCIREFLATASQRNHAPENLPPEFAQYFRNAVSAHLEAFLSESPDPEDAELIRALRPTEG